MIEIKHRYTDKVIASCMGGKSLDYPSIYSIDFRRQNLSKMDLSYASFYNVDLSHANLSHTNLSHADFAFSDLSGVDLSYADLTSVDLRESKLIGANFRYALLHCSNLCLADLSKADLRYAKFTHAKTIVESKTSQVCLTDASFCLANLDGVDLSKMDVSRCNMLGAKL